MMRLLAVATGTALLAIVVRADGPVTQPAEPASNLDYWLNQGQPAPAPSQPGVSEGTNPFSAASRIRPGEVPGVIELSDGTRLAGYLRTTDQTPLKLYQASAKRWRRVPMAAVLAIEPVIVQQEMQLHWRWKAMGVPERVYTGKKYPFRRFEWQLTLADGSTLRGVIKGQPLFCRDPHGESVAGPQGPWLLQERSKGQPDQTLEDLIYIKKVVLSRRAMQAQQSPPKHGSPD